VEKVGPDCEGFAVGDRVVYLEQGSYAGYVVCSVNRTFKLPNDIEMEKATAIILQGLTAASFVHYACPVKAGDWVLIPAAAGGTGLMLAQMCTAIGANVIGTISTDEKAKIASNHGSKHVIIYTKQDVVAEVMKLTSNKGVQIAFDGVGASTFQQTLECLGHLGKFVSFGNASGKIEPIDIAILTKNVISLMRPVLYEFIQTREEFQKLAQLAFKYVSDGKVKVIISKVYPLKDTSQAHKDLQGKKNSREIAVETLIGRGPG